MKLEIESRDLNKIRPILGSLLKNRVIVGFEYHAGFTLQLERVLGQERSHPFQIDLELKGNWLIGDTHEWELELSGFSKRQVNVDPGEPYKAYRLMTLVGVEVSDALLDSDGTLTLVTSVGENLKIAGLEDIDEDSWIVRVPNDLSEQGKWFFICDSQGHVFAHWEVEND